MIKNLILIFNFGVAQEISHYVKCLEKIYVNSRNLEDLTNRGKEELGLKLEAEMILNARKLPQF